MTPVRRRLLHLPLYVRIWLAVVLAMGVLTLLAGGLVRMTADPPPLEAVVRNAEGDIVGQGQRRMHPHEDGMRPGPPDGGGPRWHPPPPGEPPPPDMPGAPRAHGRFGPGSEFLVHMNNGEVVHVHLPRPPRPFWLREPYGFFALLGLVSLAVALGTYPVVRRLLRRLEHLQKGVEQWGTGNLSARVPVQGDDEVAYLAQRFNHAAEQVEQLVAAHKSLLANASHELRSPLARIRMGLELLGQNASPAMKAEISRSVNELDQLVDEILLASRLDAQQADLGASENVDLLGLVCEECARLNVPLDLGEQPQAVQVHGIAKLLRRMLRNLLENARRYGGAEGVEMQLLPHQVDGLPWVMLRVSDRGPGVPPELRERIFEPFYRLPGASEREGGVGLGLALVRSIVQRHGGSVRCEERPGGGAQFVVMLPG